MKKLIIFKDFKGNKNFAKFLAAMKSSRSDVFTQSVRPYVSNKGFFSLPREFLWCFKEVKSVFKVYRVFMKFQGCFKKALWVFTENFMGVSMKF